MALGLSISAFVLLLLSFPIPFLGNYITFLALVVATCAALAGDKGFTIATTLLSGIKLFLLSPSWHLAMFGGAYMQAMSSAAGSSQYADPTSRALMANGASNITNANHLTLLVTLAFLAAPIGALILRQVTWGAAAGAR